jgi:thiamine biosynthesis lipoprotein
MGAETGGAFDIAFRSRTIRSQNSLFELNPKTLSVKSFHGNLKLDLGGIGKGFALDKMAELLSEWDIRSAMLRSATSTILSTMPPPGATGWEVEFGPSDTHQTLFLKNNAFSGSSVEFRGKHVINPHYGTPGEKSGAWALASTGARADALSTAFMIMSSDEIREYISKHPGVSAWIKSANGKIAMHT